MKRILNVFLALVIFGAMLMGCAKDKGDYNYHDINTLKLSTDMSGTDPNVFITPDSIDLRQNDSLKVRLKIDQSLATSKGLSYQWFITQYEQSNANPPSYLIGNTEELKTKITLVPNLYRLVAKVTDKSTDVSYYKTFSLNVSGSEWGAEGWVVLQEQAGGSDISVITTRDGTVKGKVFNDVYSTMNGHKLPVGTYKVNVINYGTALRAQKVSFLYPNGGLQTRSIDFVDSTRAENWFAGAITTMNLQANGSAGGSSAGWEYVIVNNQIAYRQFGSVAHLANPPLFFPPFEGLSVAPFVIHAAASDQFYTLFDKVNKGFVLFNASTSALTVPPAYAAAATNLDPVTGSGFDLRNMTDNMIYAENVQPMTANSAIYWNCFFRNDAGNNTYLVQFLRNLSYKNDFTTGRFQLKEASCPGINSATIFANPTSLPMPRGVFYYVNENKVYTCTVNTLAGSAASPGLTFAPGTVIKAMKVFNSGYTAANIISLAIPEGKVLVVATDETANGGGNKVYFFNLNAQTGAILGSPSSPADVYTGFDKITDIVFKKALGR
ncbi:PKD-like family lipoprotein [Pedobacter nyackensis]|uniref:PKD-like family lipoprotein n=1 Tax=Pedobacter nyackensis TaxID=475255 RepID=UPI00292E5115|nr:PKD-like family lipoprotein [Pedobacter nyackensis]